MKITFRKLLSSVPAFRELQELKLPPRTSLDIYKLGKALDSELETYRDLSKTIYTNHNIPKTTNGDFDLKGLGEKDFEALSKDLEELMDSEVELKDFEIKMEIFEKFNIPISPALLILLDWVIKVEEDEVDEEEEGEDQEKDKEEIASPKSKKKKSE